MGGAVETDGNVTPFAEANIYHDPHAAAEVFAADWPVVLVGLDVTHQITCSADDFSQIKANAPKLGGFIKDISDFYLDFYASVGKHHGCSLHDPAAVIAAAHPHMFEMTAVPLRVITDGERQGQTIAAPDAGTPPIHVCLGVDSAGVKQRFIDLYQNLD